MTKNISLSPKKDTQIALTWKKSNPIWIQQKCVCVKIIKAVREKYPDRYAIFFDARVVVGNEANYLDHLNIEVWVYKKPSMLREIEGDHSCRFCDDPEFSVDYKKLNGILEFYPLTDICFLHNEVKDFQAIVDAEDTEHENEAIAIEDNGNDVNVFNPNINYVRHPDPFGHHRLYRELLSEQYLLEESLRQWRLEREID